MTRGQPWDSLITYGHCTQQLLYSAVLNSWNDTSHMMAWSESLCSQTLGLGRTWTKQAPSFSLHCFKLSNKFAHKFVKNVVKTLLHNETPCCISRYYYLINSKTNGKGPWKVTRECKMWAVPHVKSASIIRHHRRLVEHPFVIPHDLSISAGRGRFARDWEVRVFLPWQLPSGEAVILVWLWSDQKHRCTVISSLWNS